MISGHLLILAVLVVGGVLAGPTRTLTDPSTSIDAPNEVTFHLYTQGNQNDEEIIKLDDDSSGPSFNPANPTRLVIHGGHSSAEKIIPFKDAYLATGKEYNVILVDWSRPASEGEDITSKLAILVGDYIGEVLNHLIETRSLDPGTLIVIGHSMGGHVAGIVGNRIGGDIVSEVVALDPASDLFDDNPMEDQLDPSDAQFVQVIHTQGGGMGVLDSRGDADFFPNGGSHQAPCDVPGAAHNCDHGIVIDFFIESIASRNFVATLCSSYEDYLNGLCSANEHSIMGEWAPHTKSGSYYLETNAYYPYGQGKTEL